ncbi:MAG TPA: TadE/TadG family type IV pilus assembly protein [Pseudolabrys sp.]
MLAKETNLLDIMRTVAKKVAAIRSDQRGVSAIEFSFFVGLLAFGLLNIVDISRYIYQRMELENATQMAVQAVWKTCDPNTSPYPLPATTKCTQMLTAVTDAVHSTSLGTNVSLQAGSPAEGYYCVNGSNKLVKVSDVSSKPADCSAAGMPSLQPADYIEIAAQFAYAPIFPGITVAGAFATPITKTAMMRLN